MTIFSDFVCPFCFVGKGLVEHFKKEFDIEETWVPKELHPETPPEGLLAADIIDPFDMEQVIMTCNQRGAPYGIELNEITLLPNSRLALEATEFARDAGAFSAFHDRLFRAYLTNGENIGDRTVILDHAVQCGLDAHALNEALEDRRYTPRIEQGLSMAKAAGVTAIPTFLIQGQLPITGVVNEQLLRKALERAANSLSKNTTP